MSSDYYDWDPSEEVDPDLTKATEIDEHATDEEVPEGEELVFFGFDLASPVDPERIEEERSYIPAIYSRLSHQWVKAREKYRQLDSKVRRLRSENRFKAADRLRARDEKINNDNVAAEIELDPELQETIERRDAAQTEIDVASAHLHDLNRRMETVIEFGADRRNERAKHTEK